MNDLVKEDNIETMIYEIRGVQVMLDSDLAKLYQCKNGTKEVNQAVKNNMEKFPERYSWKLTDEEWYSLRSKILTLENNDSSGRGHYRKYLPRVFTEQGVAMLATVLKTPVATEVTIKIIDTFVSMRHYLIENKDIYKAISNINNKLVEYDDKFKYLFDKFDYKGEIVKVNKSYEAYSSILDILSSCRKELIIIDPYADNKLLNLMNGLEISMILITSEKAKINDTLLDSFIKEHNLRLIVSNDIHDRYIILDKKEMYLCGTSLNYIGNKLSTIIKIESEVIKSCLLYEVDKLM